MKLVVLLSRHAGEHVTFSQRLLLNGGGSPLQCIALESEVGERGGLAAIGGRFCDALRAIRLRISSGARALSYVPAPPGRAALYADWIFLLLCRPFFPQIVQHWHGSGVGDWLERDGVQLERWITQRLFGRSALALVPALTELRDALWFRTRRAEVVPGGLATAGEPAAVRGSSADGPLRLLFIAPGDWWYADIDAVFACVAVTGSQAARLTIAGAAFRPGQEEEFAERRPAGFERNRLRFAAARDRAERSLLFREADCLILPSATSNDLVLEAMESGVPVILDGDSAAADLLPAEYAGAVRAARVFERPRAFAAAIASALSAGSENLRRHFAAHFTERAASEQMHAVVLEALTAVPAERCSKSY